MPASNITCPLPIELARSFAAQCEQLVVVEEVEPLLETELKAQGIAVSGKDILPRSGELSPNVLKPAIARLLPVKALESLLGATPAG